MSEAIEVSGLVREFKGGIRAVDGLDLVVAPGEIYGFLGPNGAGKTTTVRMLTTLLSPTGGRAEVAGHDVADDPGAVRLRIGAALQEAAIGSADAYLWVMDGNARAERFYARHGFRALAESFPAGGPWTGQRMHRMLRTGTA